VVDGPLYSWRGVMTIQLLMISMSSSVLVGLSFNDFTKLSKNLTLHKLENGSFVRRHRYKLVALSIVLIALEAVFAVLREVSETAFQIGNTFAIVIFCVITAWFLYSAHSFTVSYILTKVVCLFGNSSLSVRECGQIEYLKVPLQRLGH
jgi:hypothetical protein